MTARLSDDLHHVLHHAPSDGAALARARRAASTVWLESASYNVTDGTLVLQFAIGSCPVPVGVAVDNVSGLVFCEDHADAALPRNALQAALSRVNARLAGSLGSGVAPTLLHLVAVLSRELGREVPETQGASPLASTKLSQQPLLASQLASAIVTCAHHPRLRRVPPLRAVGHALAGVGMQLSLMTTALHTLRRHLVCHPMPPFALSGEGSAGPALESGGRARGHTRGTSSGSAGGGLSSSGCPDLGSLREFDARMLADAIGSLPPMAQWMVRPGGGGAAAATGDRYSSSLAKSYESSLQAVAASLPAPSLLLLHWLVCLAPTRLVRTPLEPRDARAPSTGSTIHAHVPGQEDGCKPTIVTPDDDDEPIADGTGQPVGVGGTRLVEMYAVVHGGPPPDWRACTHNRDADSSSEDAAAAETAGGGSSRARVFTSCRCDDSGIRSWDEGAARAHGVLTAPPGHGPSSSPSLQLYHGTASDNAYSIAHNGLRSLSGTRHEASGSIFGGGVYVTNELGVAQSFTKAVGVTWHGMASHVDTQQPPALAPSHPSYDRPANLAAAPHEPVPCCYHPIFVCEAIAAPTNKVYKAGKPVEGATSNAAPSPSGGSSSSLVIPPGCYLVIPNPSHIRVTGLLVYHDPPPPSHIPALSSAAARSRGATHAGGRRPSATSVGGGVHDKSSGEGQQPLPPARSSCITAVLVLLCIAGVGLGAMMVS